MKRSPSADAVVWLNETSSTCNLWAARMATGVNAPRVLVLTCEGPVFARDLVQNATGKAPLGCDQVRWPVIAPRMSEVEDVLQGTVGRIAQRSTLFMYRVLTLDGGTYFVWTKGGRTDAGKFIQDLAHKVPTDVSILVAPLLVGGIDMEEVARPA